MADDVNDEMRELSESAAYSFFKMEDALPDNTLSNQPSRPARDGETLSDERRIDELLREFQMACEDAAEFNADSIRASAKHRAILRNELRSELLAVAALRAEVAEATVERRAADYLAGVCSLAVHRHRIDARSEIGDALLDYASTRYGDSNPIGGVDATYQKLRAARAASGKDHSNQQTGRDRQETESNG